MRVLILLTLLLAASARAQIGPGELAAPAGADPSVGETSQRFIRDPPAGDAPSIGRDSRELTRDPPAGDAPSIGGANEPFDPPGESAP